jgi:NhaP-type Na+/H+ and K+/H+ antiporter
LANRFGGEPAIGDRMRFGAVGLIVREMQGNAITQVGIEHDWRIRLVQYWMW